MMKHLTLLFFFPLVGCESSQSAKNSQHEALPEGTAMETAVSENTVRDPFEAVADKS